MTIAVGVNPTNVSVGLQFGTYQSTFTGSGALTLPLQIAGENARRVIGSGEISFKGFVVDTIAVHAVIRRGPGDIVMPSVTPEGTATKLGRPFGDGSLPHRLVVSGIGVRTVAGIPHIDGSADLVARLVVSGEAVISRRYITGDGALSFGLVVKDVTPQSTVRVIDIEGVFTDAEIEGMFSEQSDIEGVG